MESLVSTEVTIDTVPDDMWGWSIVKTTNGKGNVANMVAFSVCPSHIPHELLCYWNWSSVVKRRDTSKSRARLILIIVLSDAACRLKWKTLNSLQSVAAANSPCLEGVQLKHWKPSSVAALQIIGEDISVISSHSYHYVRFVPAASCVGLRVYYAWLTDSRDANK